MKAYSAKRKETPAGAEKPHIHEKFLWHCFIGLCDALAYLRTGLSFVSDEIRDPNKIQPGWVPILHRDVKPDNILLRSRATSGDRKYFYVTLSDFGLACPEYPAGHPEEDWHQRNGSILGTPFWFAPELCHSPYATTSEQSTYFSGRKGHSQRSDLWAVATLIYNLAECDANAHLDWSQYDRIPKDAVGTAKSMHKDPKVIKTYYSDQLRESILEGTRCDPSTRPTPTKLIISLVKRGKEVFGNNGQPMDSSEQLPPWATRVHEYHSKPAKRAEDFLKKK